MRAVHALLTLVIGIGVTVAWLRAFWNDPRRAPATIIAAPAAVALVGLGHWVAYDFAIGHWAGDFSLFQAVLNTAVAVALMVRRAAGVRRAA